jgi:hypothetical protein
MSKTVIIRKIHEWSNRYIPAEIIGTMCALAGAFAVEHATQSLAAAAITGSVCESIGFYAYFVWRDGSAHYVRQHKRPPKRRIALAAANTLRDVIVEFGPAEVVDSLLARPALMYIGPRLLHNFTLGLLAGKIVADLLFYTLAAAGYELRKQWRRKAEPVKAYDILPS